MFTDTDSLPKVEAYITPRRAARMYVAYVSCPFCEAVHKHGAGQIDAPPDLGPRVADCAWGDGGQYILVSGLTERPKDLSFAEKTKRLLADDKRRGIRPTNLKVLR